MADAPPIVKRFAPVFAHKVHREWPAADRITPIDLGGSFGALRHNPRRLFEATKSNGRWRVPVPEPVVYFSNCETGTHHYLLFAIYHAMDWWKRLPPDTLYDVIRDEVDEHAHDMEGALLVLRKEPETTLDALVTVAHHDFHLYAEARIPTANGRWKRWGKPLKVQSLHQRIDGNAWVDPDRLRVKLYVESRGHGIYGDHTRWGGGDEIWYYCPEPSPDETATSEADTVAGENVKCLRYRLEDLHRPEGLWEHRFDPRVFQQRKDGKWGFLALKKLVEGPSMPAAANPPWSWNDRNDTSPIGEIATDPARFYARYVQGTGPVDLAYLNNRYLDTQTD